MQQQNLFNAEYENDELQSRKMLLKQPHSDFALSIDFKKFAIKFYEKFFSVQAKTDKGALKEKGLLFKKFYSSVFCELETLHQRLLERDNEI